MPQSLLRACAHAKAYRPVIKQWEMGDSPSPRSQSSATASEMVPHVGSSLHAIELREVGIDAPVREVGVSTRTDGDAAAAVGIASYR
jgi:hypothetical protein